MSVITLIIRVCRRLFIGTQMASSGQLLPSLCSAWSNMSASILHSPDSCVWSSLALFMYIYPCQCASMQSQSHQLIKWPRPDVVPGRQQHCRIWELGVKISGRRELRDKQIRNHGAGKNQGKGSWLSLKSYTKIGVQTFKCREWSLFIRGEGWHGCG